MPPKSTDLTLPVQVANKECPTIFVMGPEASMRQMLAKGEEDSQGVLEEAVPLVYK